MGRITLELVRKRSEHNDGEISTLEELSLHQEKLIRIENLDKWCRHLRILMLQNNSISKIENLSRLKCLEYLNLAMNNIEVIQGLEGCENLQKLDLTLNFIGQVSSVGILRNNHHLQDLYLTGNPSSQFEYYKSFVLSQLPGLHSLDGVDIEQSERILARQALPYTQPSVFQAEQLYLSKRKAEKSMPLPDIDAENFWKIPTPDTPEVRAQINLKLEKEETTKHTDDKNKVQKKPRRLFDLKDEPLNINEGRYKFQLTENPVQSTLILELEIPRFMDSSLVELTVEPTFLRAIIKNKIFQIVLPEEVKSDMSKAQRSQTTGALVVTMTKVTQSPVLQFPKTDSQIQLNGKSKVSYKSYSEDAHNNTQIPSDLPPLL